MSIDIILQIIGTAALAAFVLGAAVHCSRPLVLYRKLHKWSGARIVAREAFESAMGIVNAVAERDSA